MSCTPRDTRRDRVGSETGGRASAADRPASRHCGHSAALRRGRQRKSAQPTFCSAPTA